MYILTLRNQVRVQCCATHATVEALFISDSHSLGVDAANGVSPCLTDPRQKDPLPADNPL